MAIGLANYLSGIKLKKVAVVEYNESEDLEKMHQLKYDKSEDVECFSLYNIDFFTAMEKSHLAKVILKGYDHIIIDFGAGFYHNMMEFFLTDLRIVMGSVNIWRFSSYEEIILKLIEFKCKKEVIHIMSGNREDIKYIKKKYRLKGIEREYIADPFFIRNIENTFFDNIFEN